VSAPAPILDATETARRRRFRATSSRRFRLARSVRAAAYGARRAAGRVNVGGNETGQAPTVVSKGTRPAGHRPGRSTASSSTDMAAAGLPPTYFGLRQLPGDPGFDGRQNIAQQTGASDQLRDQARHEPVFTARARGYFTNNALQSSNVPGELANAATPVTASTADHKPADFRLRRGNSAGRSRADRAWFFASYSSQDIRLVRRAGALVESHAASRIRR